MFSRNRFKLLCLLVLAAPGTWAVPAAGAAATEAERPWSVLLITVDNLRPDRMSVYGYEKDTTPYLQSFAEESAVFDHAFSTSAWTAPGIVSLVTGYYPPVHAQWGRFSFYDEEMTAALRVLADKGYEILGQGNRGPSHQGFGFEKVLGRSPDRLESFIEERINNDRPFFAWAHLRDVHLPYTPSDRNAERFGATARTSEGIEAVRNHKIILRHPERVDVEFKHAGKVEFTAEDIPVIKALYDGEVADVDERLRLALERMRETGLLDHTIVIISADHGEELFDHGWVGHASTGYDGKLYDELIHIPLIMRLPDQSVTGRFSALVQGVDIMPTLFDILEVSAVDMLPAMQGVSLLPVMQGKQNTARDFVFTQTTLKGWTTPKEEIDTRVASVRSATHKVIWFPTAEGQRIEGYDLRHDPHELKNVYPEQATEFAALEQAYQKWMADNRSVAAQLVLRGAEKRIRNIARAALGDAGLVAAVNNWLAIQTMEDTWGLEPDAFYRSPPHAKDWQMVQRRAAEMVARAMACKARGGLLQVPDSNQFDNVDSWGCDV